MCIYCCRCQETFEADEIGHRMEYVSEFWGSPAYREEEVCPFCGSDDLEEVEEIEIEDGEE